MFFIRGKIRKIFVSHIGVQSLTDRKNKLTFRIAIIFSILAFPYIFIFQYLDLYLSKWIVIATIGAFFLSAVLNKLNFYSSSKAILIIAPTISFFLCANLLSVNSGAQFLLFTLVALPLLLFNYEQPLWIGFCMAFPVTAYLLLEWKNYSWLKVYEVIPESTMFLIRCSAIVTTFLLLVLSAVVYFISNQRYEKSLETKSKDLCEALENQKKLYSELAESTSEKIKALEVAQFEREQKEEALRRDLENQLVIQQQHDKIKQDQVLLAEKARQDRLQLAGAQIQNALIQTDFPHSRNYAISAYFSASDFVSGDYFAVKELEDESLGFFVFDVTGHGVPAAIIMVALAHIVDEFLKNADAPLQDPIQTMTSLNDKLFDSPSIAKAVAGNYGVYNPRSKTLKYSFAGGESFLVYRQGKILRLAGGSSPVLKMFPNEAFSQGEVELETGDIVIAYTDGLSDLQLKNGQPLIDTTRESEGQPLSYDYRHLEAVFHEIPNHEHNPAAYVGDLLKTRCAKSKDDITIVMITIT